MRLPRTPKHFGAAILSALAVLALDSCQKYKDEPGQSDPRLSRKYCNDPDAVNFNFDFPGTADNSVCYYPSDVFSGNFSFVDSIYNDVKKPPREVMFSLHFAPQGRSKLDLSGFCSGSVIHFTANRSLRAIVDTTVLNGQILCRPKDTVSGSIMRPFGDSTRLTFNLTVVSDTGITTHRGTAYRQ